MCHTCGGFGKFCFKNFDIQFIRVANTDELVVDGGGGAGDSIKINFCPMCGRSLTPLALDGGESAVSTSSFLSSAESTSQSDTTPTQRG